MARLCACCSSCWYLPLSGKDKLARIALTEGSGTSIPTFIVSHAPTPAPAIASTTAPSLNNKLFKQLMKIYLKAQMPGQTEVDPEPRKQPLLW